MCKQITIGTTLALSTWLAGQPAGAAEHELDFKLVVTPIEAKSHDVASMPGQTAMLMKMHGVAYFSDGKIASKHFVYSADLNKGEGPFYGYSTYQFQDGSSISARFAGNLKTGEPQHGEYTVVSGTGAFANAKGTGYFDAVEHKFTGANLLNGKFKITTP
jgi:hypothetical protein